MKDFFISYNRNDKTWAEWIAWQLEENGHTTILQAWHFRPGSNFVVEMDQATKQANRTIAVLSPDYLTSSFTPSEWAAAFAKDPTGTNRTLLPVRVRECDVEGLLGQIVYIDFVGLEEPAAKDELLRGLGPSGKPTTPPGFPGTPGIAPTSRSVPTRPRFPGALPPIWNIPHRRNPNFTGRDDLLTDLHTALTSGQPAALTQAIHGLGGVGKTQLAVEYAYRHAYDYSTVWWVRSEEPSTLASDYAQLAQAHDLPEWGAADQTAIVAAVRNWLDHNTGWLLIFDNVPDPAALSDPSLQRDYLPRGSTGHVLITSRYPNWSALASPLSVKVLDKTEAVAFLLKRTKQADEDTAAQLAEELGYLPLALEQAGAYMVETVTAFADYLQLFRTRRKDLWGEEHSPSDYRDKVDATWSLAMDHIAPSAAELLNLCAFLGPDDIPLSLLKDGKDLLPISPSAKVSKGAFKNILNRLFGARGHNRDNIYELASNPLAMKRAIADLRRYSLVEVAAEGVALSIHRLLQAVVRDRLAVNEDDQKVWAEAAVSIVNQSFPQESADVRTWPECARLLAHALSAAGHAEKLGVAPDDAGRLLNQVGGYLWGRAQYAEAKAVLERTLSIDEAAYGPLHPEVAIRVNNLGGVLQALGDYEGALSLYERALSIDEAAYGPSHPNVARDVNNLGSVLRALGDYEGARSHLERALSIGEAAYGPLHPDVATAVNNLGLVLQELGDQELGDYEGARSHFERALSIDEAAYGPSHPKVAIRVNNLGLVLRALGDYEGARSHFERALSIDEAAYGPLHPDVATDVNNLGSVLYALGDYEGARTHLERALQIYRQFLGDDHPRTIMVRNNLDYLDHLKSLG